MSKVVKNLLQTSQVFGGMSINGGATYTISNNELKAFQDDADLINALTLQTPTASIDDLIGIEAVNFLLAGLPVDIIKAAFDNKKLSTGESLFKRVHGLSSSVIPAGIAGDLVFTVPYPKCKFSGAEIINVEIGDTLNFLILDTDTNTYSGLDVGTYGANVQLNQFGFDVRMPDGSYSNTSNYDADLFQGMKLKCVYTNNSQDGKVIHMNAELHEVKA